MKMGAEGNTVGVERLVASKRQTNPSRVDRSMTRGVGEGRKVLRGVRDLAVKGAAQSRGKRRYGYAPTGAKAEEPGTSKTVE